MVQLNPLESTRDPAGIRSSLIWLDLIFKSFDEFWENGGNVAAVGFISKIFKVVNKKKKFEISDLRIYVSYVDHSIGIAHAHIFAVGGRMD